MLFASGAAGTHETAVIYERCGRQRCDHRSGAADGNGSESKTSNLGLPGNACQLPRADLPIILGFLGAGQSFWYGALQKAGSQA